MTLHTHYSEESVSGISDTCDMKYHVLQGIASRYGLDNQQKETLFGISARTQARYKKLDVVLNQVIIDRLERFKRITQQAIDLFEDEEEAKKWLRTPKSGLNDRTPFEVMATDAGAKQVEQMLYRAEYGVYG